MATKVYESGYINLIDGTQIYATPLKLKYLRQFMQEFDKLKHIKNDDETIDILVECTKIAMQQYYPNIKTTDDVEDNIDIATMYELLDFAAGIKMKKDADVETKKRAREEGGTWNELDLAALESEVFLLGIWKDYEELETSLSMPELTATLNAKRELDYNEKKFLAAIQGVDLDKNSSGDEWEKLKARVFSRGQTENPNDVVALQGTNAQKAGFGIGMGLEYQKID
jgi:hypothetical protein